MKAFIIISLFFLSALSLFSYNKIEFVKDIDDYRIYGPIDGSGMSMLNDSIAVLYYHMLDDTNKVLKNSYPDISTVALANYNINSDSVEFYYDRQPGIFTRYYYDAFLTRSKNKICAFNSYSTTIHVGSPMIPLYFHDSLEIFNTSNGHIDSVFRIDGYKFNGFSNMYNGNIAFMAIKENDSLYYKNEIYVGELNPDTYSYTLTRTPVEFEKASYPQLITELKIVKSYWPNIDEEVWVRTRQNVPDINGDDKIYFQTYSFALDDSLQYRDSLDIFEKSKRQFIWRIAGGGLPGTLNHDSIYVSRGRLTNAFDIDLGINTVNVPSFTIGVDENNKYFICSDPDFADSNINRYVFKLYDYKNGITIDSTITGNPHIHPLIRWEDRGGDNFNISNDSIGVIIFRGSIWKFRLFSSTSGIDNIEYEPDLIKNIYPNPVFSYFNVEFNNELNYNDVNKIKIIDVTGKSLNANITYENSKIISINMENFSPGSYILIYNGEVRKFEVVK